MFSAAPLFAGSPVAPAGIALHGGDQVREQVVAALHLAVDLGPCFLGAIARRDQAVVREDEPQDDDEDDDPEDDPTHQESILRVPMRARDAPSGSSSASSYACACASSC